MVRKDSRAVKGSRKSRGIEYLEITPRAGHSHVIDQALQSWLEFVECTVMPILSGNE